MSTSPSDAWTVPPTPGGGGGTRGPGGWSRKRKLIVGAFGALVVLIVVAGVAGGSTSKKKHASATVARITTTTTAAPTTTTTAAPTTTTTAAPTTTTTAAPTTTTAPPMIVYTVTGGHVDITYSDPSDDTIQQVDVNGPWTKSWPDTFGAGTFYSISVQNAIDSSGPNSCTISVDGQVTSTHSASGYNIADCQG